MRSLAAINVVRKKGIAHTFLIAFFSSGPYYFKTLFRKILSLAHCLCHFSSTYSYKKKSSNKMTEFSLTSSIVYPLTFSMSYSIILLKLISLFASLQVERFFCHKSGLSKRNHVNNGEVSTNETDTIHAYLYVSSLGFFPLTLALFGFILSN